MYLGIDLGTSNSVIAGVENGVARVFHPADGGETLPSAIYIDKRGHRLYGRRAYDQALVSPENVATGFKRLLGTATPVAVGGQSLTPEECSAEIIRQLIAQAATETGEESFDGVVIAVPAAFNQMQAEATLRAAKMAGLEKIDLIQEPVAAAMASMAEAKRSGCFLVYDLGGGTFDVALVESEKGKVSVLAQRGVNMLGGRDFDRMIVHEVVRPWLLANFELPETFLRQPHYKRLARIAQLAAERAKIELSQADSAAIFASDEEIKTTDCCDADVFLDAPITRAQIEALLEKPVANTIDMIQQMLEEREISPSAIDRIVFVGGSTRIPYIRRQVVGALCIVADLRTDPATAVAQGAAYYCEGRTFFGAQDEAQSAPKPDAPPSAPPTDGEEKLSFDYSPRTAEEATVVTVRCPRGGEGRSLRLMTAGWDSGMVPLADGMALSVPLHGLGENVFDAQIMDAQGAGLEDLAEALTITRLVAQPQKVLASQTLAVKARRFADAQENVLLPLVNKGDALPASGRLDLKSGAALKAGAVGALSFEVFQVETPDRVDLNLCVGLLRIDGTDLPAGQAVRIGDPVSFDWQMSVGGVLRASVVLPAQGISLPPRHFYAPEAAQVTYDGEDGAAFARAILARAEESWGEIVAATGPVERPETALLKARIDEQREFLEEAHGDGEAIRRVSEEARFIRQEAARLEARNQGPLLQRRLGRLVAAYNRMARRFADAAQNAAFDELAARAQKALDGRHESTHDATRLFLSQMRRLFFTAAWRDDAYVRAWLDRLSGQPWLFADRRAFAEKTERARALLARGDAAALRRLVEEMMEERLSLGSSDGADERATIVSA